MSLPTQTEIKATASAILNRIVAGLMTDFPKVGAAIRKTNDPQWRAWLEEQEEFVIEALIRRWPVVSE